MHRVPVVAAFSVGRASLLPSAELDRRPAIVIRCGNRFSLVEWGWSPSLPAVRLNRSGGDHGDQKYQHDGDD